MLLPLLTEIRVKVMGSFIDVYGKGSYETANTAFIHWLDCTEGVNKLQFCIQPVFLFMKSNQITEMKIVAFTDVRAWRVESAVRIVDTY